jgi:hypothetical protein
MYDGKVPAAGIVTGIGRVNGIECMIVANDVRSGLFFTRCPLSSAPLFCGGKNSCVCFARERTGYGQGRIVPPDHGQEAPPRAGNRKGEQTPVHLPRSVRCTVSGTWDSCALSTRRADCSMACIVVYGLTTFPSSRSRIRRRRSALSGRRLPGPRPLWPHLLQHGSHERRGYPVCLVLCAVLLSGDLPQPEPFKKIDSPPDHRQLAVVHGISVAGGA